VVKIIKEFPQKGRLRNDLYCVEWDVKLYYTIPTTKGMAFVYSELSSYAENTRDS